jgi:hypothetical protein
METNTGFWPYLAQFFLEWKIYETKVAEKIETHILYSIIFLRKSCRLRGNVEKFCKAGQTTNDNMAHCELDN